MFASLRRFQATPGYTQFLQTLKVDLKQAMIAKNGPEKNTIKAIMATLKNREIEGAKQTDASLKKILGKMIKQRKESEQLYRKQNRADLADIELKESAFIQKYSDSIEVEAK
ncbi:hypothetical protein METBISCDRAFT_25851 [Metschnikowia bicuspidata]|uniref:Altered inheritance of mitochondria protein 41 n=1 Tax=Metschnikowia bicuspidata TaxID=27322 RepID=A0A4P9ZHB9_9ASCO|nr:hypothetical protein METBISCDRAFT_25851 [Metschnikowia bicuspidata]